METYSGTSRYQPGRPLTKAQKRKLQESYKRADSIRAESERVKTEEELPMAEDLLQELDQKLPEKSAGQDHQAA